MKICVFGDSVAKGVVYDETRNKYTFLKNNFVNLFSKDRNIDVKNWAKFGCTTTRGREIIDKHSEDISQYDYTILEFGGNDCNFDWAQVSSEPEKEHFPAVSSDMFKKTYSEILDRIKECGSKPVLLSMPPLNQQRFFNWISKGLNKENISKWLGDIDYIYRWQESYNLVLFQLAQEHNVPIVDIRKLFLEDRHYDQLICVDGMHPSEKGHALINSALADLMI